MSDTGAALEPESFVPLLEAIRDIFLRHDFMGQATVVADVIDLAHLQSSDFASKLGGGEMWGSAGSVADAAGLRHSLGPVDDETVRDSLELTRLLIQLAEQMKAQVISSEGSEFVARAFGRGLERRRRRDGDYDGIPGDSEMIHFGACPYQGVVRPLVTARRRLLLRCEQDNLVWLHPSDIGSDRVIVPTAPNFGLPDGDSIAYGTWRWATADEVEAAGWSGYVKRNDGA